MRTARGFVFLNSCVVERMALSWHFGLHLIAIGLIACPHLRSIWSEVSLRIAASRHAKSLSPLAFTGARLRCGDKGFPLPSVCYTEGAYLEEAPKEEMIIGVHYGHDSTVAVSKGGRLQCVLHLERLTKERHWGISACHDFDPNNVSWLGALAVVRDRCECENANGVPLASIEAFTSRIIPGQTT